MFTFTMNLRDGGEWAVICTVLSMKSKRNVNFSSVKIRLDAYFLSPQKNRPGLFGIPVIVPCTSRTRQCDLYKGVWVQVARLLSPPAPGETNCKNG